MRLRRGGGRHRSRGRRRPPEPIPQAAQRATRQQARRQHRGAANQQARNQRYLDDRGASQHNTKSCDRADDAGPENRTWKPILHVRKRCIQRRFSTIEAAVVEIARGRYKCATLQLSGDDGMTECARDPNRVTTLLYAATFGSTGLSGPRPGEDGSRAIGENEANVGWP
jgi:hypothetical protein